MNHKILLLTILLVAGFSFPNCGMHCDCDPIEGAFFDVKGMDLSQIRKKAENGTFNLKEGERISFMDYSGISIKFDVDFLATKMRQAPNWSFSLIDQALACDCIVNGLLGSKEEHLDSLKVITLNDFDVEHPANSPINDLLLAYDIQTGNVLPLNEIVANYNGNLKEQVIHLFMTKAPELDETFKANVIVVLSTGEVYEKESIAIEIAN